MIVIAIGPRNALRDATNQKLVLQFGSVTRVDAAQCAPNDRRGNRSVSLDSSRDGSLFHTASERSIDAISQSLVVT